MDMRHASAQSTQTVNLPHRSLFVSEFSQQLQRELLNLMTMVHTPEDFKCPISLELMTDPVILSTGQTYDRSSIEQWLDSGHRTCPKTKQFLYDTKLIPNYALRSLIYQWASVNAMDLKPLQGRHISAQSKPEDEGLTHIKPLVESLLKKLSSTVLQDCIEALKKMCALAKEGKESRVSIVEAGGIACLLSLLRSQNHRVQEATLAVLWELSMDDENRVGLVAEGAVDAVVHALKASTMDGRTKAATILTSLALVDVNKVTIGSQQDAIRTLVKLIAEGNIKAKKESMSALCRLCMYHENKSRAVSQGAVPLLLNLLIAGVEPIEYALTVLDFLSTSVEGRNAIMREPALPTLMKFLSSGTPRSREQAASVLWSLCSNNRNYTLQALKAGALDICLDLIQVGTSRAKRKAACLVKAFQECQDITVMPQI